MSNKYSELRLDNAGSEELTIRHDFIVVPKMVKTDEGYLKGLSPIAKVGVMKYLQKDGTVIREFVSGDTLFNADSLASLHLKPITNDHPPERLLDSRTVKNRKIGSIGETVKGDGDYLMASMIITDGDAIDDIQNGRKELSPGYTCTVKKVSGEWNGQKYDAVQLSRTYNHVAICDKARGGSELRLKTDSIDLIDGIIFDTEDSMEEEIKIDGIAYKAAKEVVVLVGKLEKKATEDGVKLTALQAKVDSLTEDNAKLKVDMKTTMDSIPLLVAQRTRLCEVATKCGVTEKTDSLTVKELKAKIIMAKQPKAVLTDKPEAYIDARYDALLESLEFDTTAITQQKADGTVSIVPASTTTVDPVKQARTDAEKRVLEGWKNISGKDKK